MYVITPSFTALVIGVAGILAPFTAIKMCGMVSRSSAYARYRERSRCTPSSTTSLSPLPCSSALRGGPARPPGPRSPQSTLPLPLSALCYFSLTYERPSRRGMLSTHTRVDPLPSIQPRLCARTPRILLLRHRRRSFCVWHRPWDEHPAPCPRRPCTPELSWTCARPHPRANEVTYRNGPRPEPAVCPSQQRVPPPDEEGVVFVHSHAARLEADALVRDAQALAAVVACRIVVGRGARRGRRLE